MTEQLERFRSDPGAVLLDVRSPGEYAGGHIPGSVNLPLEQLNWGVQTYPLDTPVYLYCLSGARSSVAAEQLRRMGYETVIDLGGLNAYHGKVEQ